MLFYKEYVTNNYKIGGKSMENKNKIKRVPTRIHTREMDRAIAKINMKKKGLHQICKGDYFARNWKFYI